MGSYFRIQAAEIVERLEFGGAVFVPEGGYEPDPWGLRGWEVWVLPEVVETR